MTETRPVLMTTDKAARLLDIRPDTFRSWARRRDLRPVRHVRLGRSTIALWDMDQVFEAEQRDPKSWRQLKGSTHGA